jgi:hypothetical protein
MQNWLKFKCVNDKEKVTEKKGLFGEIETIKKMENFTEGKIYLGYMFDREDREDRAHNFAIFGDKEWWFSDGDEDENHFAPVIE